eukprot:sb/3475006/
MTHLQPVNYSVKFEGEEGEFINMHRVRYGTVSCPSYALKQPSNPLRFSGGGPGVNRGWFSVLCTSLRNLTKYPDQTLPLLYCPGRIPEQSDIYAPRPWNFPSSSSALYKQRLDGMKAIGRFIDGFGRLSRK